MNSKTGGPRTVRFSPGVPASARWPRRVQLSSAPSDGSLFPIPLPDAPHQFGQSKVSRRRWSHRYGAWEVACGAVEALNDLYGCSVAASKASTPAQLEALSHILSTCSSRLQQSVPSQPEAASLLLGARLEYLGDGSKVVAFEDNKVSWPDGLRAPVPLQSVLSPRLQQAFTLDNMLADDAVRDSNLQQAPARCHLDARLRASRPLRLKFY